MKCQIECNSILKKEIKFLNEVEKKRNRIIKNAREKHNEELLIKLGKPVEWIGYKSLRFAIDLVI